MNQPLRRRLRLRQLAAALAVAALFAAPAGADDRDLLRLTRGKPYVFIMLDTSATMNNALDGTPLPGGADDPRSRLFIAKQALYEVLKDIDNVHYGFATFPNQDNLRVADKHWLYFTDDAVAGDWPIAPYPASEADGVIEVEECIDAEELPVDCASEDSVFRNTVVDDDGDASLVTFGTAFVPAAGDPGSCSDPLTFSGPTAAADLRAALNAYSFPLTFDTPTSVYFRDGGTTYRLRVTRSSATGDNGVADPTVTMQYELHTISSCGTDASTDPDVEDTAYSTQLLELARYKDFLYLANVTAGVLPGSEDVGGYWDWQDAIGSTSCNTSKPHSGFGWEGNYDPVDAVPVPPSGDQYCNGADTDSCLDLKYNPTSESSFANELDRGDMIPLNWDIDNKDEFLARLAPNHPSPAPDFGIASYFSDLASPQTQHLALDSETRKPVPAYGVTPIAKALVDYRCFYSGVEDQKCNDVTSYPDGWGEIAAANDPEWGCRRPYLITISDGDDNCVGENPCSDTANLRAKHDIRQWSIALTSDCECKESNKPGDLPDCKADPASPLNCMAQNSDGQLVCADTTDEVRRALQHIIGVIIQEARTFASAAVPSVQATVTDKVFLTNFTPLNERSVWDGHLHNFLKPLPRDPDTNKPDTELTCPDTPDNPLDDRQCHKWDAGDILLTQVSDPPYGETATTRRVFYSNFPATGESWVEKRNLWEVEAPIDGGDDLATSAIRYDLWKALNLYDGPQTLTDDEKAALDAQADSIIDTMLTPKTATDDAGNDLQYILGDIFHSNPIVVDTPPNTSYFAGDVPGYREFARRHKLRRRLLLVGSNDGMLHGFEAGIFDESASTPGEGEHTDGTGIELFAYMPRLVMPSVVQIADNTGHRYTVDGSPIASDVFIDPLHTGAPTADEREWRTVSVTGLREGGAAYFALDITQPDPVEEVPDSLGITQFVPRGLSGDVEPMPACLALGSEDSPPEGCGPVPYPAVLWEFEDKVINLAGEAVSLNEDWQATSGDATSDPAALLQTGPDNAEEDLADTWSAANIGRVRINECDDVGDCTERDLYVAVFGGGSDPANKRSTVNSSSMKGNWLYMIDIETGKAIYKHQVEGSIPGEAAAVDTNSDGYFDRIYFGTTAGYLYRVDLAKQKVDADTTRWPELVDTTVRDVNGETHTVQRIATVDDAGAQVLDVNDQPLWLPRKIFDANGAGGVPQRPIYFRPSVIFVPRLGEYALAFGTGDREDLWSTQLDTGRFFMLLDDVPVGTVANETSLVQVAHDADNFDTIDPDYLDPLYDRGQGEKGWYLELLPEERVITNAFGLVGLTVFSTYIPKVCDEEAENDADCELIFEGSDDKEAVCGNIGSSRAFVVLTNNANAIMQNTEGNLSRTLEVANATLTELFTEQGTTKNPTDGTDTGPTYDELDERLLAASEQIKGLMPKNCKFANFRTDLKAISSNTEVVNIVAVPTCLIEKNWKEF
jgi:hypothetical protein